MAGPKEPLKEATTGIEFRILGPVEAVANGRQLALGGSKQRTLLALLLLQPNRVVSRDHLIDELWDSAPPESAATALQVHVSQLRKALGRDTIVTRAPGYMINVDSEALDIQRFERLVNEARGQEPGAASTTLREALALWRGTPLADLDDSFARAERARLDEQRAAAVEQRIGADLELGLHAELVPELEALVREDPLRERRRAQLMLALYRSGRQAEALEVYRNGRRLLAAELGLEPGEELRQLEKAILEHDPALAVSVDVARHEARNDGARVEPRHPRRPARSRLTIALGTLVLAGALAATIALITGGSGTSSAAVFPNSVAAVNPKTGRVIADVPVGGRPVAIAIGAGAVWVVNGDDETVVRIDPKTHRVVKAIGGLGSDLNDIAFGFGSVWVAGGNNGTLTRIDPQLNAPEGAVDLGSSTGAVPQPVFLVATGAGYVWATRGYRVLRIDPGTDAVTASVQSGPVLGLAAGAGSAWVTKPNEHLLRIDAVSAKPTADPDLSQGIAFPIVYGGSLWVIVPTPTAQIWRIDPNTLTPATPIPVANAFLFGLTAGDGALWTADHDRGVIWRIDPATGKARRLAKIAHHPIAIAEGYGAVWIGVQAQPLR